MKYWLNPQGESIYAGQDHAQTAKDLLRQPRLHAQEAFRKLLEMGWFRMIIQPQAIFINNPHKQLNSAQQRSLKDMAMEQKKDLMDDSRGPARILWSPRNVFGKKRVTPSLASCGVIDLTAEVDSLRKAQTDKVSQRTVNVYTHDIYVEVDNLLAAKGYLKQHKTNGATIYYEYKKDGKVVWILAMFHGRNRRVGSDRTIHTTYLHDQVSLKAALVQWGMGQDEPYITGENFEKYKQFCAQVVNEAKSLPEIRTATLGAPFGGNPNQKDNSAERIREVLDAANKLDLENVDDSLIATAQEIVTSGRAELGQLNRRWDRWSDTGPQRDSLLASREFHRISRLLEDSIDKAQNFLDVAYGLPSLRKSVLGAPPGKNPNGYRDRSNERIDSLLLKAEMLKKVDQIRDDWVTVALGILQEGAIELMSLEGKWNAWLETEEAWDGPIVNLASPTAKEIDERTEEIEAAQKIAQDYLDKAAAAGVEW